MALKLMVLKQHQTIAIASFLLWTLSLAVEAHCTDLQIESGTPEKFLPNLEGEQLALQASVKTDFAHESTPLIRDVLYQDLSRLARAMAPSGAAGVNIMWEHQKSSQWYIEAQRTGETLVIGGLMKHGPDAVQAGFKMFDWGFTQQTPEGGFKGTGDPFHSTSFFVQAVARSLLVIQQSSQASQYAKQVRYYKPLVHQAARWMISSKVWERGIKNNHPYTHRRYLVATALGLTGKLTGDRELLNYSRRSLVEGLSLQRPDGVNPEKGGHDSSYQMVGIVYAQRWATYFPNDPLTPQVTRMINKGMNWEKSRVSSSGQISNDGNTRTAGEEKGRSGKIKAVDYKTAIRGFAYWASVTKEPEWTAIAQKITRYYASSNY